MRKKIVSCLVSLALIGCIGCGSVQNVQPIVTAQHPAWAMNPATCTEVGTVLPFAIGLFSMASPVAPVVPIIGGILGNAFCQGESSLVNGQPAVQVTTTTTTTGTSASKTN